MKKTLFLGFLLLSLTHCKTRSKTGPQAPSPVVTPTSIEKWSGRTDFSDSTWQIKSQP